jgi:putative hemolysin
MKTAVAIMFALALCACTTTPTPSATTQASVGMANPASVACINQGGKLDLRKDEAGNVSGICVFADGRQCEEWALFRDHQCVAPADVNRSHGLNPPTGNPL